MSFNDDLPQQTDMPTTDVKSRIRGRHILNTLVSLIVGGVIVYFILGTPPTPEDERDDGQDQLTQLQSEIDTNLVQINQLKDQISELEQELTKKINRGRRVQ